MARTPRALKVGAKTTETAESTVKPAKTYEKARARTRGKLLRAAKIVMGKKGIEATAINDITEEAEVSFGSFYNYFSSKEAIARAVFIADAITLANILDEEMPPDASMAFRVGINIRRTMRYCLTDTVWGWFLVHSAYSISDLVDTLGTRMARDLKKGIKDGSFTIVDVNATANFIVGGSIFHLRQILEGDLPCASIESSVFLVLCGIGVPVEEARRIIDQPLEDSITKRDE
ncbi:TetR/AcrR family transcriptional regulator [Pseudomonas fluorescens]|nr:TetR/AcrR family transcriptional regulator [Pseudomonas fluorescens]